MRVGFGEQEIEVVSSARKSKRGWRRHESMYKGNYEKGLKKREHTTSREKQREGLFVADGRGDEKLLYLERRE